MAFVPFRIYSGFSYLRSGLILERIPKIAKKLGYQSVGVADYGTLSGLAPFAHGCKAEGLKPIYGMDLPLEEGTFTLIVLNEKGYRNLLKIALAFSENQTSLDLLRIFHEGLAIIYALEDAPFFHDFLGRDTDIATYLYKAFKDLGDVYLGIPYLEGNNAFVSWARAFAERHSYQAIALPHIMYQKREDAIALSIVTAIQEKRFLEEKKAEGSAYFLSPEEANAYFTPEEIAQTEELASKINFSLIQKRGELLVYPNTSGLSSPAYLRKLAFEGLDRRTGKRDPVYVNRLEYELSVIEKMGYSDYFLIVGDYVNWAKTHGVSVGPGRGSGAGSLVAYCLNIVDPDPIKYDLLFERFLNPDRQSMPDIDIDFSDLTRDRVVVYLQDKYGKERVGRVLTTQTIGAKEALRDIGRVYQYKEREINLIIDTIVNERLSLREDYRQSPQFKKLIDSDPYFLEMVSLASKIEGLPRQAGLHAAGVVLNDKPLGDCLPVSDGQNVGYVACLEKDYLEEQGFLKFDLLGLRNLSIVDQCISLIERYEGVKLDAAKIPHDDPEAIRTIAKGKVMGLFQLESPGMRRAIREVDPTSFNDIAAVLALFRPGPMQSIPTYAKRKKGLEKFTYPDPSLEPFLRSTYGIIVYQEQVMQIAQALAGFTFAQADTFRRAISKKDAAKLQSMKESFVAGCKKNGKSVSLALRIYDLIEKFADYGFNKSHAVSYAFLTGKMAYLKTYYPKEFYCAILGSMSTDSRKFKDTLSEIKALNLSLAIPDVNLSGTTFSIHHDSLRFPLNSIKGIQTNFVNSLLDERDEGGPFQDIFDFASRMKRHGLNQQTLIKLIDAGALDTLYPSRATLRASAFSAMNYAEMMSGESGQEILLSIGIEKPAMSEMRDDPKTNLQQEYEALGMMVSGSPLSFYSAVLEANKITPLRELESISGQVWTAGIVKSIRAITTRKGTQMAFLELYDDLTEVSFVLFAEAYSACYSVLKRDAIVMVRVQRDRKQKDSFQVYEARRIDNE